MRGDGEGITIFIHPKWKRKKIKFCTSDQDHCESIFTANLCGKYFVCSLIHPHTHTHNPHTMYISHIVAQGAAYKDFHISKCKEIRFFKTFFQIFFLLFFLNSVRHDKCSH